MEKKIFLNVLPRKGKYIDWMNEKVKGMKVHFIYGDLEDDLTIKYCRIENNKTIVTVEYNNIQSDIVNNMLKKCGIGNVLNKKTKRFKFKIGQKIKNKKTNLTITDRKIENRLKSSGYNEVVKKYKYKCNKCGFECGEHYKNGELKEDLWVEESQIIKECGCSCCVSESKIIVQGINDIPTTAPWMVKYFQGGYDEAKLYTDSSSSKIYPICPDCGNRLNKLVQISNINRNKSIGCNCSDNKSRVTKYIYDLLFQLTGRNSITTFDTEIRFNWCRFYNKYKHKYSFGIYDFVVEDNKIIIEADGGFHRKDNRLSGQTKEESVFIDSEKDRLAKKNGYKVIRISDECNIKENILNSELNNIFDLSCIDWDKSLSYSLGNMVKEVCGYWHLHNDINEEGLTTKDMENIFKLNRNTISNYLKKGSQLNWCSYDAKEEIIKGRKKKTNGKSVEIFKDGQSLGVFPSCSELARRSEELFGIKLLSSKISAVCINKNKIHKGFVFAYKK